MLPALVRKTWRDDRRATIGWAVGLTAFTTVYIAFYPQFRDIAELKENALPTEVTDFLGVQDMTSAEGYLEATIYSLIGPLLLIMAAITLAARTIPRPEEDGGMELLLTTPVSRRAFATQRLLSFAATITALAAVPWLFVTLLAPGIELDIPASRIAAISVALIALVWCFGGIAFLVGAVTGRRGMVLAVAGGIAVAGYLLRAIARIAEGADWVKWLSPFHYFSGADPLRTGWHLDHIGVLVAVAVVTAVAGVIAFDRRDVGV
jgi:ABC-2 type transport system permease protein